MRGHEPVAESVPEGSGRKGLREVDRIFAEGDMLLPASDGTALQPPGEAEQPEHHQHHRRAGVTPLHTT